jgi:acyl-CoA synthetase (AMP-forming)/AMP-acid ligase II
VFASTVFASTVFASARGVPNLPVNLTTVSYRDLHAVLLPELPLPALVQALDGGGPALLLLDPGLPEARLSEMLTLFAPTALMTPNGTESYARRGIYSHSSPGVAPDVAVVLATSGSTGRPKAVELTAGALYASARASLARLERLAPAGAYDGRWLCCLPRHHISGLGVLVRSLVARSLPEIADGADAALIESTKCEYVSLVPTQLSRLLAAGAPLGKFHAILLGGAPAAPELLAGARAAGARVVTTYGMTETCGGCVYNGVPLDGVRVDTGPDGRIRIGGPSLFSRYRLAPELTAENLADGWFLTSDLGEFGADGRLVVHGRADDVINTGGRKVVPGEVEAVLRECKGVREVVVIGVPDPDWGEEVTAIVVPAAEGSRTPELAELRAAVQTRLPRYAAPHRVVHVPEIPMLASGKPDRLALRNIAARPSVS